MYCNTDESLQYLRKFCLYNLSKYISTSQLFNILSICSVQVKLHTSALSQVMDFKGSTKLFF